MQNSRQQLKADSWQLWLTGSLQSRLWKHRAGLHKGENESLPNGMAILITNGEVLGKIALMGRNAARWGGAIPETGGRADFLLSSVTTLSKNGNGIYWAIIVFRGAIYGSHTDSGIVWVEIHGYKVGIVAHLWPKSRDLKQCFSKLAILRCVAFIFQNSSASHDLGSLLFVCLFVFWSLEMAEILLFL